MRFIRSTQGWVNLDHVVRIERSGKSEMVTLFGVDEQVLDHTRLDWIEAAIDPVAYRERCGE